MKLYLLVLGTLACNNHADVAPVNNTPLDGKLMGSQTLELLASRPKVSEIPVSRDKTIMTLTEKSDHPLWSEYNYKIWEDIESVVDISAKPASPKTHEIVEAYLRKTKGVPETVSTAKGPALRWKGPPWRDVGTLYFLYKDGTLALGVNGI